MLFLLQNLRDSPLGKREPGSVQSAGDVLRWWEIRRIAFNLIVGATGIGTCILCLLIALVAEAMLDVPIGIPDPPIIAVLGIITYGIMANVCYTGGWIAELVIRRLWPRESDSFASLSHTLGVAFAVILTLFPAFIVFLSFLVQLFLRFVRPMSMA